MLLQWQKDWIALDADGIDPAHVWVIAQIAVDCASTVYPELARLVHNVPSAHAASAAAYAIADRDPAYRSGVRGCDTLGFLAKRAGDACYAASDVVTRRWTERTVDCAVAAVDVARRSGGEATAQAIIARIRSL